MINEILTKKPFARVTPLGHLEGKTTNNLSAAAMPSDTLEYQIISQADFLREYEPSGHKINSPIFYPNKKKYDEITKQFFEEKVFRAAFPFQMLITIQHLVHLCGNDIRFELTGEKDNDEKKALLLEYQKGWLDKNMEIAFYEFAKSVKITGDGAIAMFMNEKKVGFKNLSFLDGDTLYPHYDSITGKMTSFARKYNDYDDDGKLITSWVEVWDEKYLYRYKQSNNGIKGIVNKLKVVFGIEGYTLVGEPELHQFNEVPIIYHRDKYGACWTFSQDSIEKYELAISHLCQNNMAYAFPIMLLKGDDVEIQGDIYGAVKAIAMGKDDDAGFMNKPSSSDEFKLQIETLLKMIFMGSFAVVPPEIKSGDLPGVAIKLIYSPSLEKAMMDCKDFDSSIDKITRLFKFGYGIETGKSSSFEGLQIFAWADPYIHQNSAELITNLVQSVTAGFLSKETASETSGLGKNYEWDRIMRETKEAQQADKITQLNSDASKVDPNAKN